jgi:hypothetical protein
MDTVLLNTKRGKFGIDGVYKIETADGYLYIFYDDKKAKIPLDDIISLSVS